MADAMLTESLVSTLRQHLPKDRYDDEGCSVSTYCTCGNWEGDYFADGDAGPFDDHLAEMLEPVIAARVAAALGEVEARIEQAREAVDRLASNENLHRQARASAFAGAAGLQDAARIVREVRGELGG